MTDTPLDLDYIEHRMASPMVTYRESVEEDMPALVAALRKAEAQVAAVLALADGWTLPTRKPFEPLPDPRESALSVAAVRIRAAVDGA